MRNVPSPFLLKEVERVQNAARASAMEHDTSVQTKKINQIY